MAKYDVIALGVPELVYARTGSQLPDFYTRYAPDGWQALHHVRYARCGWPWHVLDHVTEYTEEGHDNHRLERLVWLRFHDAAQFISRW